jgi:hypothetical protein
MIDVPKTRRWFAPAGCRGQDLPCLPGAGPYSGLRTGPRPVFGRPARVAVGAGRIGAVSAELLERIPSPLTVVGDLGNAGPHSAEPSIPDKDEVPGSSPGRPTSHSRRSQRWRQRAGSARCLPGPRWGRTPTAAGTPTGPSGPATRPSGSAATTHRGRAPSPGRQPRGGCGHLAPPPAPAPTAQPQRQVLRTPAWPAWSLSGHTRPPPPAPTRPGPSDPIDQRATAAASPPQACWAVDRAARRHGRHRDLDRFLR